MTRYVKNDKGYEKSVKADWDTVKKGLKKAKKSQNRVKSSRKSKSKGFDINKMEAITLKKGLKLESYVDKDAKMEKK